MRFCDLKLRIERTPLAQRVRRLYRELDKRQIGFRPHVWLSEEWFSPDGVPGIAVPFYLAHPRLERLERRMMRNVGRRQCRKRDAHPAARSRSRDRYRVPAAPSQALARSVWTGVVAVSGYLQGAARQPPLCATPRRVVCAVASLRGLRRNLCRVAEAEFLLAAHLRALAGVPQTRSSSTSCWTRCAAGARRCATAKSSSRCATTRARWPITTAASSSATTSYRRTVTDHLLERIFTDERARDARRARQHASARASRRHW